MAQNIARRPNTPQEAHMLVENRILNIRSHGVLLSPLHQEEKRKWESKEKAFNSQLQQLQSKALPRKFAAQLRHLQLIERLKDQFEKAEIYYHIGYNKRTRDHFEARHTFFQQMHFYLREMTRPGAAEIHNKNVLEMYHLPAGPGHANDSIRWRQRQEVTPYWGDVLSDTLIFRYKLATGAQPVDWLPICKYTEYFTGTYKISPEQGWRICVLVTTETTDEDRIPIYPIIRAMNLRGQIYFRSQSERWLVPEWCNPDVICPSEEIYARLIEKVVEGIPRWEVGPQRGGFDEARTLAKEYESKAVEILRASRRSIRAIIERQDAA